MLETKNNKPITKTAYFVIAVNKVKRRPTQIQTQSQKSFHIERKNITY